MKHTSKRLLSILLCLVLMLSLIPAAYAEDVHNVSQDDVKNLADACKALRDQIAASANPDAEAVSKLTTAFNRLYSCYYIFDLYFQILGQTDGQYVINSIYNECFTDFKKYSDRLDEPGISLYPAVKQMNRLYGALGAFATRTMIANSYEGFKNLAELFPKDSAARANALNGHKDVKITVSEREVSIDSFLQLLWTKVAQNMIDEGWAPSPEGMFESAGLVYAAWYDYVGQGVITDTNAKIDEQSDKIEKDVAAENAKIQESINNALAGAFPNFGQG